MATINLNVEDYGAQYKAFVDFASKVDENTIVRRDAENTDVSLLGLNGEPRKIIAKTGDGWGHFWRGSTSQTVNKRVRDLFMETVLKVCGVTQEKDLPKAVYDAMRINDFKGKGHPLTARRINAVNRAILASKEPVVAEVDWDTANSCVVAAVGKVDASRRAMDPNGPGVAFDDLTRKRAVELVVQTGGGLTGNGLKLLANVIVAAIASGRYEDEVPEHSVEYRSGRRLTILARNVARDLKGMRNFALGDARAVEMNARLTEYWRSLLDYRVKNAHYSALVGGVYNMFALNVKGGNLNATIGGEQFENGVNQSGTSAIDRIVEMMPNVAQRVAITSFLNNNTSQIFRQIQQQADLANDAVDIPGINLKSVPGSEMLLTVPPADEHLSSSDMFELGAPSLRLDFSDGGRKAKVSISCSADIKFGVRGAGEWKNTKIGSIVYEMDFEFDLSDENAVKLVSSSIGQTIETE